MKAIPEIGLLPEVFDTWRFETREAQELVLRALLPQLRNTLFLRILSYPQWRDCALSSCDLDVYFKEFVEVLEKHHRLIVENGGIEETIGNWLAAYQRSHRKRELVGLVIGNLTEDRIAKPPSANILQVFETDWWINEKSDLSFSTKGRLTLKYHFGELMSLATRFDFVDPYLNPEDENYAQFLILIGCLARSPKKPLIAFHTALRKEDPQPVSEALWRKRFNSVHRLLHTAGKSAQVRIWDPDDVPPRLNPLHDRFLLTNLVNFSFGRGFACTPDRVDTAYAISKAKGNEIAEMLRCDVNPEICPELEFAIGDPQ